MTITRLLIANRGEIAVRIARTAHRMGIGTVGVYSEPDVNAVHVDVVDVAIALGGATPIESYLQADAVLQAALDTGCDAIHPGYGFLAENAAFAQRVIDAGLIWVGPTPEQIALLGDKIAAKQAAVEAGVPTTGVIDVHPGVVPDDVPMPALVKAAAGGGGRGMRIVRSPSDLASAIEAATREAASAFGNGTVFIEPYIERGRHIEVQIMGDAHGNVIHLGERECSIQRRNQKVIEESPSAGISAATRTALCEGALALARHVGYQNAGTVEFLVGEDGTVTFLEVNTRLQVEHPVTEAVTGLDLVELQLVVASGGTLPLGQQDVTFTGHAIEVRLVAEDPAAGWLPSTGTLDSFDPAPVDGIRIDAGVRAGAIVSSDYDSLLAKIVSHADERSEAAARLARALRVGTVTGVRTNAASLAAILNDPDFLAAATPTAFLDEHAKLLSDVGPSGDDLVALLLGVVLDSEAAERERGSIGFAPSGWRNLRTQGQRRTWQRDAETLQVEYVIDSASHGQSIMDVAVSIGPWPEPSEDGTLPDDDRRRSRVRVLARSADRQGRRQVIELDGRRATVWVRRVGDTAHASSASGSATFVAPPRFVDHEADVAGGGPVCPLPGTVIAVHVEEGQEVAEGDLLMVVEAMKMEHKITAGAAATVEAVRFAVGDRVDSGDLLVALVTDEDGD